MTLSIPLNEVIKTLNETSWQLLKLIQEKPNFSFKDIRNESNLSQEKCYKELCRLEGGVLVVTNRDQSDRRVNGYSITQYGQAALEQYIMKN